MCSRKDLKLHRIRAFEVIGITLKVLIFICGDNCFWLVKDLDCLPEKIAPPNHTEMINN